MGMSTHVVGFRPADDLWHKMESAYRACEKAGVPIPPEVSRFFDYDGPGDRPGKEVSIEGAVKEYSNDYSLGFEVDLTKLPKDVTVLRFYNSV